MILFLTSERAIYSSFMKISVPSPVFRGKTLRKKDESETLQSLHARMSTRYNKIREFDTLERQTMGMNINMQAHSRWLHAIRKGVITEKKRGV